jgi:hypothetical protein
MELQLVPTLAVQREFYAQKRTMARFRWYLRQMLGPEEDRNRDIVLDTPSRP